MSLSSADIKNIVEALHKSDWDTASIVVGDVSISVGRNGTGAAPAAAPAQALEIAVAPGVAAPAVPVEEPVASAPAPTPAPESSKADGFIVKAPSVGVFWRAPEPGAEPFVKVGQRVEVGDTLCIVEIMKLMNNVTAEVAGTVVEVLAENAQSVEYGTQLFAISQES